MEVFYCQSCMYHIKDNKCEAFDKIPNEIIYGEKPHDEKIKGQKKDYVYSPLLDNLKIKE